MQSLLQDIPTASLCDSMQLEVLGCAGGIGGRERWTTCLLLDADILFDAGTGITNLATDQLTKIDHIFLSHSHLDHIVGLALLADSVAGKRINPITVHATDKVINALKSHLFNWSIWPDFTKIPTPDAPILRWDILQPNEALNVNGRVITPIPVSHSVDAVGYWVENQDSGFLFTGDMSTTPELWDKMKKEPKLKKVIIDCSFTNADIQLAALSGHFCPQLLINDIREMPIAVEFLISHLKPGQEEIIMRELRHGANWRQFDSLQCGARYVFEKANVSSVGIAPPMSDRSRKTSIKIRLEKGSTKK